MPGLKHKCLAEGCTKQLDARYLMCAPHWSKVPADIQREVYAAYRPGQDITTATEAWRAAADKAVAEVRAASQPKGGV